MNITGLVDGVIVGIVSAARLDREIERRSQAVGVLVVDMAGFSRITAELGVAAALIAIRRMQLVVMTAAAAHAGRVVKFDADNAFCAFPDASAALAAGRAIVAATPCSAGVGYGRTFLDDGDLFGAEVNAAARLGEDVARHGEVLLTAAAQAALDSS